MNDHSGIGRVLSALGDPTRQQILELLADDRAATATALAARLPISRQAVAKHLQVLEQADLVRARREGREARYALRPAALRDASTWIAQLETQWDERLAALKDQAETAPSDKEDP